MVCSGFFSGFKPICKLLSWSRGANSTFPLMYAALSYLITSPAAAYGLPVLGLVFGLPSWIDTTGMPDCKAGKSIRNPTRVPSGIWRSTLFLNASPLLVKKFKIFSKAVGGRITSDGTSAIGVNLSTYLLNISLDILPCWNKLPAATTCGWRPRGTLKPVVSNSGNSSVVGLGVFIAVFGVFSDGTMYLANKASCASGVFAFSFNLLNWRISFSKALPLGNKWSVPSGSCCTKLLAINLSTAAFETIFGLGAESIIAALIPNWYSYNWISSDTGADGGVGGTGGVGGGVGGALSSITSGACSPRNSSAMASSGTPFNLLSISSISDWMLSRSIMLRVLFMVGTNSPSSDRRTYSRIDSMPP